MKRIGANRFSTYYTHEEKKTQEKKHLTNIL